MATKTINWNTGGGSFTVTYGGFGNGTIVVASDANTLHESRSQSLTVKTTKGGTVEKTITVAQAMKPYIDLTNAVVTAANQTYSGSAQTPTPTVKLNGATVPSTGYDVTYSNNTNAGTATISITGKEDYTGAATGTFTIAKADPTYIAPVASTSLTYNGSSKYLTTAGSTSHGTIYYSLDGTNWYTTRRTKTNAGTYTSYWKLTGDVNHNDVASTAIITTIAKASGSVTTVPTAKSVTYNGNAQTIANAGSGTGTMYYRLGTSGSYSTTIPNTTNPGDYTLYYYAAASTNYEQSSTGSISITMKESYSTNYGYVSSGLVFALDGVSKGHDSTKWLDLVGGLEFPFENVTKGTNKVTFNGSGIMKCTTNKSFPQSTYTIEIVAKNTSGSLTFVPATANNVLGSVGGRFFCDGSNRGGQYCTNPSFDRLFSSGSSVYINGRKMVLHSYNTWTPNSGFISIGGRSASDSYRWSGDLYGIRIYNRKLSESEILQNQGIDNTRFGFGINMAQDYISDGLVFQLDGINKGADSNNWTDLIGGLKFPYGNNATKGTNYVQFNGTGSIQCAASKSFSQTACTIEVVADRPPSDNSVIFYPAVKGEIAFIFMGIANQTLIEQGLMAIEYGTNSQKSWYVRRDDKMMSVNTDIGVGNTKLASAGGNDSWGAQIDGKYKIGGRNTDYLYTGKIYAIRIYNRKLSHAEIAQNQRLDNIRFGINDSLDND